MPMTASPLVNAISQATCRLGRRHVAGCDFVHHVASPFIIGQPNHEDDLIIPARDGALRVLRAAAKAGVKPLRDDIFRGGDLCRPSK